MSTYFRHLNIIITGYHTSNFNPTLVCTCVPVCGGGRHIHETVQVWRPAESSGIIACLYPVRDQLSRCSAMDLPGWLAHTPLGIFLFGLHVSPTDCWYDGCMLSCLALRGFWKQKPRSSGSCNNCFYHRATVLTQVPGFVYECFLVHYIFPIF